MTGKNQKKSQKKIILNQSIGNVNAKKLQLNFNKYSDKRPPIPTINQTIKQQLKTG